ncbi:MAG: MobA protein [Paludibacter sp.]|nr:MobA protein [Paludibacter sp.]MBP9507363.1 MobA protein [Bacteroides sp.]
MNEEKRVPRKRGKGGRPPKNDPAKRRLTVNLTDTLYAEFLSLFEQSGVQSLSAFIAARIFGDEFRVVKTDASAVEFIAKLTALHAQIRSVGVNYNQVVKELHSNFGEKKALALLFKLENATIELAGIGREVLQLCEQFKAKHL